MLWSIISTEGIFFDFQCNKVSKDHNAEHAVEKEARKWATKIAKETRAIKDYNKTLKALQTGEYKVRAYSKYQ